MKKIVVEKMEKMQIEECAKLFMDTFSQKPWNEVYESKEQVRQYFERFFQNSDFLGCVLLIEKQIKAICVGMKKPWLNGVEYYVDEFCVSCELQKMGYGTLFLKEIETDIKNQGMNGILLNTEKTFGAYHFYKKNQFQCFETLCVMGKQL